MLLHLLLIFALFNSVSCNLLCCRLQPRVYNYSLTTDTIPSDISHCEPGYGSQTVMIGGYSTSNQSLTTSDSLSVNIRTSKSLTPTNPFLKYTIDYTCSTSGCNNGSVVKRLLETLTLKDQYHGFLYLLESNTTGSRSCLLYQNQTATFCDTPMPVNPTDCRQCTAQYYYDEMINKMCATCNFIVIRNTYIERQVYINITNRTRSEVISTNCNADSCTFILTGNTLRQGSTIELDFDKFLAPYPIISQQIMIISSFPMIISMIMILVITQFV